MDNVDTMENLNSVGSILKEARVKKGLSLIDAEKATTIRCAYLDALEQDEYYKLPEEVFIKGIVDGGVRVSYGKPILVDEKYADIKVDFTISEVDPYDSSTVFTNGSFRGMTATMRGGMHF
jgi:transcriptional regulator with XRE-family HTH domain